MSANTCLMDDGFHAPAAPGRDLCPPCERRVSEIQGDAYVPSPVATDQPREGKRCSCGARAVVVYVTPNFGRVGHGGVPR